MNDYSGGVPSVKNGPVGVCMYGECGKMTTHIAIRNGDGVYICKIHYRKLSFEHRARWFDMIMGNRTKNTACVTRVRRGLGDRSSSA